MIEKLYTNFSELLIGSTERVLIYPCNSKSEGPDWSAQGDVIHYKDGHLSETSLLVVALENGKFRLAENPCFEDLTSLYWGDEFYAKENKNGDLEITKIDLPLKFKHQTSLIGGSLKKDDPFLKKILMNGGNWELVAGGILITSIPIHLSSEF